MSIGQFLNTSFAKLRKGSLLTGPQERIGNFFPEVAPIPFGSLLKYGSSKKNYVAMTGSETDASAFAGIATAELAASPRTYPGVKTQYEVAEAGNVLLVGDIAIELSAAVNTDVEDVIEGAKVYLGTDGKVTPAADNGLLAGDKVDYLLLPKLEFTGDIEVGDSVTLVGVRKLY